MMHLWIITSKISSEHTLKNSSKFLPILTFSKISSERLFIPFPFVNRKNSGPRCQKVRLGKRPVLKKRKTGSGEMSRKQNFGREKNFANSKLGGRQKNAQTKMSCLKIEKKYSSFSNWWKWPFLVEFISSFEPKNNSIKLVFFCLSSAPNWTKIVSRKAQ